MKFRSQGFCSAARLNRLVSQNQSVCTVHSRHLFASCRIGSLNICSLRNAVAVQTDGTLYVKGFDELEFLKCRMTEHGPYALCLQELRWPGSGHLNVGNDFVMVYQGSPQDGSKGGCGILLSPPAAKAWMQNGSWAVGCPSGRILRVSLKLGGSEGRWHLFSTYGPTMQCPDDEKQSFWTNLSVQWQKIPQREIAFLLGDMNARVGCTQPNVAPPVDPRVLGPFGFPARNSNGDLLLNFCNHNGLKLLNTWFQHDPAHLCTWCHRRWGTDGMIDFGSIGRFTDWRFVTNVRAMPGVEFDTDHFLVILDLRQAPQAFSPASEPPTGSTRPRRLFVSKLGENVDTCQSFADNFAALRESHDSTLRSFTQDLRTAGELSVGEPRTQREDWRVGHEAELAALARARQSAHNAWRASSTDESRAALRAAQKASRTAVRAWKNAWWQTRLERLEQAAQAKDSAHMFGEAQQMSRLLRSNGLSSRPIFENPAAATQDRAQHFRTVLNVSRTFTAEVWDELPDLSHEAAAVDWSAPSWDEFLMAVRKLQNGKAPDILGVHAELLKALYKVRLSVSGHQALLELHSFMVQFWHGDLDPQHVDHWHHSVLFVIFKGKGNYQDLHNHRGVVLLDICSKLCCKLIQSRLASLAERV